MPNSYQNNQKNLLNVTQKDRENLSPFNLTDFFSFVYIFQNIPNSSQNNQTTAVI